MAGSQYLYFRARKTKKYKMAYSIIWADFLRMKSHQINSALGKVENEETVKIAAAQRKTGAHFDRNWRITPLYQDLKVTWI